MWIRIGGTAGLIVFALWGVALGLWQQIPGLSPDQADCEYRVELMRERLVRLMDRSLKRSPADSEADKAFANLLRETRAACADEHPDLAPVLERMDELHAQDRERRRRATEARSELQALSFQLP